MNKKLKELIIVLVVLIVLIAILLTIDYLRLSNGNKPIFSISIGHYLDGGTKMYYGLFYKIIDYNVLDGYDGIKVGTWFLGYDSSL